MWSRFVLESVVPVGMVETGWQHGIAKAPSINENPRRFIREWFAPLPRVPPCLPGFTMPNRL